MLHITTWGELDSVPDPSIPTFLEERRRLLATEPPRPRGGWRLHDRRDHGQDKYKVRLHRFCGIIPGGNWVAQEVEQNLAPTPGFLLEWKSAFWSF